MFDSSFRNITTKSNERSIDTPIKNILWMQATSLLDSKPFVTTTRLTMTSITADTDTNASTSTANTATTMVRHAKIKHRYKIVLLLVAAVVALTNDWITWNQNRILYHLAISSSSSSSTTTTTTSLRGSNADEILAMLPPELTEKEEEEEAISTTLPDERIETVATETNVVPPTTTAPSMTHHNTELPRPVPLARKHNHNRTNDDENVSEEIRTAGIMYSICRADRSGNVIADMMYAHAFAFGHHITYGGSCCLRPTLPSNTTRTLIQALGWETLFPFHCPEGVNDNVTFQHLSVDSPAAAQSISPFLWHQETYRIDGRGHYFRPAWRQHVETILKARRTNPNPTDDDDGNDHSDINDNGTTGSSIATGESYEIAVHLRRGDVSPCRHFRRYLPNSHYLALIDQYTDRARQTNATNGRPVHVTIYSESDTYEPFDEFRERNYTLELDTANLGPVWKALATADVVILSRSTFSIVPAIMNPNVVVATEFMDFDPNHVHDGEFDVKMIDGWEQADPTLVQQSDQIIHDMVRTQCPKGRALTLDVINDDDFYDDW